MDKARIAILHFVDDHVFGSMRLEVVSAIRAGAERLATLGLVTQLEILGGIATGDLGVPGRSRANFDAFLPYLGRDYSQLTGPQYAIYERLRCGLVHEHLIKGKATLWTNAQGPCGIVSSPNGPTYVLVQVLSDHVFEGACRLRDLILANDDGEAARRAFDSLARIGIIDPTRSMRAW